MGQFNKLYQKGDIVTVRIDLDSGRTYGGTGINRSMASMAGKTVVISNVRYSMYTIEGSGYAWNDAMFDPPGAGDMEEKLLKALINKNITKADYNKRIKLVKKDV